MSKKSFIDSISVSSPCSEDWEKMHGNDRVRFCDHCAKNVRDLSAVRRKEAMRMVQASGGGLCVRYVKDPHTGLPLFADQLINITRRSPGIAAGVMTASLALSTAAFSQNGTPASTPEQITISRLSGSSTGDQAVGTAGGDNAIDVLPAGTQFVTMGAVAFSSELRYEKPLTNAVMNDDIDEVRELIAKGANVNGKEESKITPLFVAVEYGNFEIAKLLLEFGAKVNARDNEKQTPLMRLDDDATVELVELLLTYGAKVDLTDKAGNTALILAAERVTPDVLKTLIDADSNVNAVNKTGQTALMNAAEGEKLANVRSLLLAGAKVNLRNNAGDSAWDLTGSDEIEELLVSFGAEVPEPEAQASQSDTPQN